MDDPPPSTGTGSVVVVEVVLEVVVETRGCGRRRNQKSIETPPSGPVVLQARERQGAGHGERQPGRPMAVHQGELFGERSSGLPAFRFGMGTVEAISAASRHRIRANRLADTDPFTRTVRRAENRLDRRARAVSELVPRPGVGELHPGGGHQRPFEGHGGSRCRRRPSTKCEASAAARARPGGNLHGRRGRPVPRREQSEDLTQLEVLAAEHVAAALAPRSAASRWPAATSSTSTTFRQCRATPGSARSGSRAPVLPVGVGARSPDRAATSAARGPRQSLRRCP